MTKPHPGLHDVAKGQLILDLPLACKHLTPSILPSLRGLKQLSGWNTWILCSRTWIHFFSLPTLCSKQLFSLRKPDFSSRTTSHPIYNCALDYETVASRTILIIKWRTRVVLCVTTVHQNNYLPPAPYWIGLFLCSGHGWLPTKHPFSPLFYQNHNFAQV